MKSKIKKPTIERLPSGTYRARIMIDGHRVSFTGPTTQDVTQQYYTALAHKETVRQQRMYPESMTVRECLNRYIEKRRVSCSPSTIRGYVTVRENAFPDVMDDVLYRITDADFQRAINAASRKRSGKTVVNQWSVVSAAIKEAAGRTVSVQLPPVVRNEHEFLTAEQIPRFLDAIKGKPVEMAALLGLHSLRRSEIADLTWNDVDMKNKLIHVRGSAVYDDGQKLVHKATNKTSNSRRDVPIMIPRLGELLQEQRKESGYVVTLAPETIARAVNRACLAAELPEIGCHGLRHSFASLALHVGMSPDLAMRLGGWDDLSTMKKIYTHVSNKDLASAAAVMADFFK